MSKFNPDFWEVTLSEEDWQKFTSEDRLGYESPEDLEKRHKQSERAQKLWSVVRAIMDETLTPQQHKVVYLYFFEGLNQREIAEKLKISQQSVSEHLYGKKRRGRAIGGALRKLRKACIKRGVQWD